MNNFNIPILQQQMDLKQIIEELKKINYTLAKIENKIYENNSSDKKDYMKKNDSLFMI